MIKVAIAEDNVSYLNGLAGLLREQKDMEVVITAPNGTDLLQKLKEQTADVVVMDIEMPLVSGIEATQIVSRLYPHIRVIGLTVHTTDPYIHKMLNAGAVGYLDKNTSLEQVAYVIRNVAKGEVHYCLTRKHPLPESLLNVEKPGYAVFPFSDKELDVIRGICAGHTKEQICKDVFLSPAQYENLRQGLLRKTGAKKNPGIIVYAVRNNLL